MRANHRDHVAEMTVAPNRAPRQPTRGSHLVLRRSMYRVPTGSTRVETGDMLSLEVDPADPWPQGLFRPPKPMPCASCTPTSNTCCRRAALTSC